MRSRPLQDVRVWSIQIRETKNRPYSVRWVVDGRRFSRAFRTRAEADRHRSRMLVAQQDGERFSTRSGEPESWSPVGAELSVYVWARQWVGQEWREWSPRTRKSEIEALTRFVPLAVDPSAPAAPALLRHHLNVNLRPEANLDEGNDCERWLARWSLNLGELDEQLLAEVERQLGIGDEGQTLAPNTAGRYRRAARSCIVRAVELKMISRNPWPPARQGRSKRKARRQSKAIDIKRLPDPATMAVLIASMANHQPASRMYQTMTAVSYFAGLRPSEVVMLRTSALNLPEAGWGRIEVVEADDGFDQSADPKTGPRSVPIPAALVDVLRRWTSDRQLSPMDLLFRTRGNQRPLLSNWNRALKRASLVAACEPISTYDCRHACATTWLRAGVPLGEVALRLGHSVETLVAYYVGALQGDDLVANDKIDTALQLIPRQVEIRSGD